MEGDDSLVSWTAISQVVTVVKSDAIPGSTGFQRAGAGMEE